MRTIFVLAEREARRGALSAGILRTASGSVKSAGLSVAGSRSSVPAPSRACVLGQIWAKHHEGYILYKPQAVALAMRGIQERKKT